MATSDNLLISIQEKIKWADTMSESDKKHCKEVDERIEDAKKMLTLKVSKLQFSVSFFPYFGMLFGCVFLEKRSINNILTCF